ncbi:Gfo/Idh/MocA family protein [Rubrivirga sp.]|uniref:Gfo/Idh/MocA family protein n=1 Tax=Rubrivirga sp. TaxID=1885344 RepID=UPI003B52C9F8
MTRIGLIGCGHIAQVAHLPALRRLPGVEVVAVADPGAGAIAAETGAAQFADAEALLAGSDAEAVVIATPTATHADLAVAAFAAGRHVYLEKPIALDVADGRRVVEARRRAGTVGRVGFNFRFNSQVEAARAALAEGRVGEVVAVRTVFSVPPQERAGWRGVPGQGGHVLLDVASHHVDLVRHLLADEVVRAFATTRSLRAEADHATLALETAGGVGVQTFVSLGSADEFRLDVYGTAGRLTVDRTGAPDAEITEATFDRARARRIRRALGHLDPRFLLRSPGHAPSFERALGAFVGAVRGERTPGATLDDGLATLAVVEAALDSARTGRPVDVTPTSEASP